MILWRIKMMKRLIPLGMVLGAALAASAAEPNPGRKGFIAHEWGVFRVNQDADFANAELRAEWDNLPAFIYGYIKGRVVPQHWGAVEIRFQPLVFFYSDQPLHARVKIDFPGGMPGVWYPATHTPSIEGAQKQPKIGDSLQWAIGIKQPLPLQRARAAPPVVSPDHWIARARKVKCDEIFASFGPGQLDAEREKFIFYDGLFPQGRWMKIVVDGDNVKLTSQVGHPVFDVTIVDRRKDKPRIARIDKVDAKKTVDKVEFFEADASRFVAEGSKKLLEQLVFAGLYEDEAQTLIDSWKKDMFDTPGVSVFYRLPQSEYDARMPLTITPKPNSTVRVGLIYHGHLEPDFAERILEQVKRLDSERFADREAATKKLLQFGPAALVQLQRLQKSKDLSVEVRERLDVLIKKWNAKDGFDQ
jgi:hypothetical protein